MPHIDDAWDDLSFIDIFNELFDLSLLQVANVYDIHRADKGESWQLMDVDSLRLLFLSEINEFNNTEEGGVSEYNEVIDIVLVGLMLIEAMSKRYHAGDE